jgi:hypothetical protein
MTELHPATLRPLLPTSEEEQALRVLAGGEPRPTCGGCRQMTSGLKDPRYHAGWCHADWTVPPVLPWHPACDLYERRQA